MKTHITQEMTNKLQIILGVFKEWIDKHVQQGLICREMFVWFFFRVSASETVHFLLHLCALGSDGLLEM